MFMCIKLNPQALSPAAIHAAMCERGDRVGLILQPASLPLPLCEFSAREGFPLLAVADLRKLMPT